MSQETDPRAEPDAGRRPPITRAQLTLQGLRKLPRVVWLLGLASLLNDVSSEAIFPLLPTFLVTLGAPMSFLGLIEGSADALSSLIKMASGKLSDRGPRRTLVASGYAMPAIARARPDPFPESVEEARRQDLPGGHRGRDGRPGQRRHGVSAGDQAAPWPAVR